jgi:hypothetical protein
MISSSGAAVGFPGANADSTGVTGKAVLVREGSADGMRGFVGVAVGAATQEFKRRMGIIKKTG